MNSLKLLWPILKTYRGRWTLGFFFILISAVIENLLPIATGWAVDAVSTPPLSLDLLTRYCLIFLGLLLLKVVFEAAQSWTLQTAGESIGRDLRSTLLDHLIHLPVPYFDKNPTGRLLTRVINDVRSLGEIFTASFSVLLLDIITIVGTMVTMFWLDWRLACFVLLPIPLLAYLVHYYGSKLAAAHREVRRRLSEVNAFLGENIPAIIAIQRLSAEKARYERFQEIVGKYHAAQLDTVKHFSKVQPYTNILNGLSTAALIIYGGHSVLNGSMSLGIVVAFLGFIRNLYQPIRDLVEKYNTFLSAFTSAERIGIILNEPTEELSLRASEATEATPILNPQKGISFRHVNFTYATADTPTLTDIDFSLEGGKSLAITGPTGSGKSTLSRLLLRFYEPDSGEILFQGIPLKQWPRPLLREKIASVQQEVFLFEGTLRDNLNLMGTPQTDAMLKSACETLGIWHHLEQMGGLDTPILEGGNNLSLGEKQLIALTRTFLKKPELLILDEATASIDRKLENTLLNALKKIMEGKTCIIIAHRLSTIEHCDQRISITNGTLQNSVNRI